MLSKIWSFIGSVRFVIILLIVFAVISVVGVVIPQGLPPEEYLRTLGTMRGTFVQTMGFDHLFSTWWFYSLLGLLALSVLSCTSLRLLKNLIESGRHHFLASASDAQKLKFSRSFSLSGSVMSVKEIFLPYLNRHLFSSSVQTLDTGCQIAAKSGRLREVGSLMFHLGLIVLFIGGLMGRMGGSSHMQQLSKNQTVRVLDRDFSVRCDWFKLEKNADRIITDYKTKLTIIKPDGSVALDKIIEVNHPLRYQGVRFYQSSYGEESNRFADCSVRIAGPGFDSLGSAVTVPFDSAVDVASGAFRLRIERYVPDFIVDMESHEVSSRSDKPNNPAIKAVLTNGTDTVYNNWAFARFPDVHEGSSKYQVAFLDYSPEYFSGIQIVHDPGTPFIWLGIICMTFGILLLFYISRRTLWIFLEHESENPTRVTLAGSSNRHPLRFQEEFTKLCASLERSFNERK